MLGLRLACGLAGLLSTSWARALGAASAPAGLPFKPEADGSLPGVQQWLTAVVLCTLALAAALWWLRRRNGGLPWAQPAGRLITVLDRAALSPQVQLVAAQYGTRRLLLAVGPGGTQCVRDDPIDTPTNIATPEPKP